LIKNSQPFGKNFQKTAGGGIFLTHTVYYVGGDITPYSLTILGQFMYIVHCIVTIYL